MSKENVELVRRQHQAFNRGDVAGILELLDADIEWWDRDDDPGACVHRGHEGVAEMLAELDDLADLRVEAKDVFDAGDYVVVPVRLTGRGRTSGVSFEEDEVHLYKVRDGKITELREYRHRNDALKAAGLEE
jgi:uncharacterized protein